MSRAAPDCTQGKRGGTHPNGSSRSGSKLGVAVTELYRGRAYLALLRDLALEEWSYSELAQAIGVPVNEIAQFAEENSAQISEVKEALAGKVAIETAGLWITHKANRLAELQGDFEDTQAEVERIRSLTPSAGEHGVGPGSKHHRELIRTRSALLRAVAEELGQFKTGPKAEDAPDPDAGRVHFAIEVPSEMMEALS